MKLIGKVVIVTGGANGIGEAAVREMITEGATVVIVDINDELGTQLEQELNQDEKRAIYLHVDVTNESEVESLIKHTVKEFGKLDIVFNNAGVSSTSFGSPNLPIAEQSLDVWKKIHSVNVDGVFIVAKHAIKAMIENGGGSIINTASILGHVGKANSGSYSASKGAVVSMTRSMALEYAGENIRINAVCPGYVETDLLNATLDEEKKNQVIALHPIGRLGKPSEVAKAVVFLASDEASFITGTSLLVDGGYTAQ